MRHGDNRALGNIWDSKNLCLVWNSFLELLRTFQSNSVQSSQGRHQHSKGLSELSVLSRRLRLQSRQVEASRWPFQVTIPAIII